MQWIRDVKFFDLGEQTMPFNEIGNTGRGKGRWEGGQWVQN